MNTRSDSSKGANRLWVKCRPCGHVWAALHLPMEMTKAARCMKRIYCPACGETKQIFTADAGDIPEK